jgi:hypothetical protein
MLSYKEFGSGSVDLSSRPVLGFEGPLYDCRHIPPSQHWPLSSHSVLQRQTTFPQSPRSKKSMKLARVDSSAMCKSMLSMGTTDLCVLSPEQKNSTCGRLTPGNRT